MTKKYIALSLCCMLSLGLVSCSNANDSSVKETSNKETKQTEITNKVSNETAVYIPPQSHNTNIHATFYNYLDGKRYGGYLSDRTFLELKAEINSLKTKKNLINKFSASDTSKQKEITHIMEIETDEETISYLGQNMWMFESGGEISIYKTSGAKNTELPCAFMAAQLCIPYAFSEAKNDKETNEDYLQLKALDTQEIADYTHINYSDLSEKLFMNYPDSPAVSEDVYIFNSKNAYTHYSGLKILDSKAKSAYRFQRDNSIVTTKGNKKANKSGGTDKSDGDSYYFFRYGDDTYCRNSAKDTYHKAEDFKDDFFIKDENLFFEQLVKNFDFQFSFPVKVYDKLYTIEMYKDKDSYLAILVNEINHPGKAWMVNNDGITIATDLMYNEIANKESIESGFVEELDSIKKQLSKENSKKDTNKKN